MSFTADDFRHMANALRLAELGLFTTDPNPRVGCVLVRDGVVVGEGWHRKAGGPHAEIEALRAAGKQARGATAYLTLEPCCHQGKTPPCTLALIEAGVSRVVAAMQDPNPQVAGNGFAQLQAAGIATTSGLMEAEAGRLNPGFISRMHCSRPYVRSKLAMSLDGRTAMASGESKWITGDAARCDVHRLRARSSAILTGVGTVLLDDPSLNVRLGVADNERAVLQPLRVVVDSTLRLPADARMLGIGGRTLVVHVAGDEAAGQHLTRAGAEVVQLPSDRGRVNLNQLMRYLADLEINEIMVEAGATLNGALLQADLVDELVIYMAPHLMGDSAKGLFHLPELQNMNERVNLEVDELRMVGKDLRITARPGK